MARKARIDAHGAFHHIICRGIERRKIFYDDADRDNFLERLENILKDIWKPSNQPLRMRARSLVSFWAVTELGMSGTRVGKLLRLGQPAVNRAVRRAEKLAQEMSLKLVE